MSNLFLIQADFYSTPVIIQKLKAIYSSIDHVVLMGDAIQFISDPFFQSLNKIYILETDSEGLDAQKNIQNIEIIQYSEFADICLQHARCISLK